MIRLRSIVWVTLLATLFSAASPALAAFILADRPAALGKMLGLPTAASGAADPEDSSAHAGHEGIHSENAGDAHHDDSHQSHSLYCSLCLNPSSIATLAPLPPSLWLLGLEFDLAQPAPHPTRSASFLPLYRSRAPPVRS
jgi:hypothetical protein